MKQIWKVLGRCFKVAFFATTVVAFIILVICIVGYLKDYYFYEPTNTVVIRNYYRAVGLDQRIEDDDMSLTKELYGEPNWVEEEPFFSEKLIYLHYDGFSILFRDNNQRIVYYGFELYSPDRKIRRDIHVGSTREEIINAYQKCPSIDYWERNGFEKGDKIWDCVDVNYFAHVLTFSYDENDIVTCIRYIPGDAHWRE